MGSKNKDRWTPEDWRLAAGTVERMIGQGWRVMAVCTGRCANKRWVDLKLIARVRGGGFVLWNTTARCRTVGCGGPVHFVGLPPSLGNHEVRLSAEWVGGELRNPPGRR